MAFLTYADRVAETTTTTGTGTIQLGGAVDGKFRTFVAGAGSGNTVPYVMVHRTANEWEVGYGVVTSGSPDTLTRAGVYSSSNGGSAVNFSAGTKDVFLGLPAGKTITFDDATGSVNIDSGTLYVDAVNNRVGVGTATPSWDFDIARSSSSGSGGAYPGVRVRNTNTSTLSVAEYQALAENGVVQATFAAIYDVSDVTTPRFVRVGTLTNHPLAFYANSTERARITAGGNFIPGANNAYSLGDGSTRWTEVFAINGTINTSDANAKTDVQEDVPGWEFVKALRPVHYVWKVRKREAVQVEDGTELVKIPAELDADGNEITPARTEERPKFRTEYVEHAGKRRHLGFIAQEVKEALGERDFGLFTQDAETGECGLRYDQFAAPFAKVLQEAMARIETLEARLAALEAK